MRRSKQQQEEYNREIVILSIAIYGTIAILLIGAGIAIERWLL